MVRMSQRNAGTSAHAGTVIRPAHIWCADHSTAKLVLFELTGTILGLIYLHAQLL